ncbi:MAG: hypothetical protein MMC33_007042 [Icmadophila ericetorum]|nr:hypothetical protein [Icmadophila ericetorum]
MSDNHVLTFDYVVKGSAPSYTVTIWPNLDGKDPKYWSCTFEDMETKGKPKAESMEKQMKLQEPFKKGEETWTIGRCRAAAWVSGGEDEDDAEVEVANIHEMFVKCFDAEEDEEDEEEDEEKVGSKKKEAMGWMSLGANGETVITTKNWED